MKILPDIMQYQLLLCPKLLESLLSILFLKDQQGQKQASRTTSYRSVCPITETNLTHQQYCFSVFSGSSTVFCCSSMGYVRINTGALATSFSVLV